MLILGARPLSIFPASGPNGINQVGCVYTAQGFEFDYVGVIWGRDLRWDPATNDWIGHAGASQDSIVKRSGDRFTDLVKRTYVWRLDDEEKRECQGSISTWSRAATDGACAAKGTIR